MKEKRPLRYYIATGIFLFVGLCCIMLGFGIANGWQWVISWFTSQWAMYVYIFAFFYAVGAICLWWWGHNNNE